MGARDMAGVVASVNAGSGAVLSTTSPLARFSTRPKFVVLWCGVLGPPSWREVPLRLLRQQTSSALAVVGTCP